MTESAVTLIDGSLNWSDGIDSIKVTTVQSEKNPDGLKRTQLAWLNNASVRGGGILQRTGWQLLGTVHDSTGLYQGGFMYQPDSANPYLMLNISGQTYKVEVDKAFSVGNASAVFVGTNMPANIGGFEYAQGENYLVIQANDGLTLPLFWDGTILRRSLGITNPGVAPGTPGVNEIPAAGAMDYYMGRLWYAQGRQYSGGDIVGGPSGTPGNRKRDAILEITENPLVLGGDGFTLPTNAGNIRAIFHNANLNAQLGQGQLMVGTRKAIYSLQVPVTRNAWILADTNNQPQQNVVQLVNGPVNSRSIVKANGDVFYQTLEPSIASLFASIRYFDQWGNRSISANEQRVLSFVDRSLLHAATGIVFNNRLWQSTLPFATPQGVAHQMIIPMDFIPIASFGENHNPVWEGVYEDLFILQLFVGDFGGRERAFAVTVSKKDSSIQLWELTDFLRSDFNGVPANASNEARVTWVIETPAYTFGDEFSLKKLVTLELWLDKIFGSVDIKVEWRPDSDPCWQVWHQWKECAARTTAEDCANPISYPIGQYRESFRATRTLPRPPEICESATGRPAHIAYQFQLRITVKGWMRIRGIMLRAEKFMDKLYHQPTPNC